MARPTIKVRYVDFWPDSETCPIRRNLHALLSRDFDLELSEQPDFLFYSCFGRAYRRYDCIRIFYSGENVRPKFHECDYALSFDFPTTERNYRLPLYKLYPEFTLLKEPRRADSVLAEDRDFCSFLSSNPRARVRNQFFRRLRAYRPIASGGRVLNNLGAEVENKMDFLRRHKFAIAFENSAHPGYTTEKLLHALVSQAVPIYWGNPLVGRDFNTRSFVNCHDYPNFDAVIEEVKRIDKDDKLYRSYLAEPYFPDGIENPDVNEENIRARIATIFSKGRHHVKKRRTGSWFFSRNRVLRGHQVTC
jgi:hypothetical protein